LDLFPSIGIRVRHYYLGINIKRIDFFKMPLKVFQKFGLKRDLNLADVPAKRNALNNLLDGLSDGITPFTWEDIQVIQNIYLSDVTTGTFINASNATVLQIQPNGDLRPYSPLITLENRFDKAYFTTSEPFFAGGDGLSATYYDNDGILRATPGDAASDFVGLDGASITDEDDFWERGYFNWPNRLNVNNRSLYGAIKYEGYIKPSVDGFHSLRLVNSRGFFRVEFDDKSQVRDFTYDPITNTFNYNNYNFTSNAETGLTGGLDTLIDQTKLDQSTNLSSAFVDGTSSGLNSERTVTVSLGSLVQWEAYKIRITWFIDEAAINPNANIAKIYHVQLFEPNGSNWIDLNYKKLFTKEYFQAYDIGDFRSFVESSISVAGTNVGTQGTIGDIQGTFTPFGSTPIIGDSYVNVNNFNPIVSYYSPPNTIAEVEEVVPGCTYAAGSTTVGVSNALPNSTEFIEVGNFVKGTGITPGTRVTKVIINSSIEISPTPTANGTGVDLTFINHRGLVAFGDNGTVTSDRISGVGSDYGVDDILPDSIILCSRFSTDFGGATFDDQTTDPTTFGVSIEGKIVDYYDSGTGEIITKPVSGTGSFAGEKYYVYQSAGLIDDGLKFFCQGVFKARLLATQIDTSSTSVVLTLDSEQIQNVSLNDWVHAFPAVNFGQRPDGSVQELFSKVQVTNINLPANQITITNTVDGGAALLTALEYIPAKVKNIVFTPTDVNREVCFKPTDTSPPFAANSTGLITSNGVAAVNDFSSQPGGGVVNINSSVAYNDLEIVYEYPGDPNAATKLANNIIVYNNENISAYLPVEDDAGNTFYMMLGN